MAISFVNSLSASATSGGTFNISRPTSSTQDDVIFAAISAGSTAAIGAFTWPAGWNVIHSVEHQNTSNSDYSRWEIAWHVFSTGELNYSITVPALTNGSRTHTTAAYRGCSTTTPVIQNSLTTTEDTASSSALSTPTATSSTSGVWAIAAFHGFSASGSFSWSPGTGLTERTDAIGTGTTVRQGQEWADTNGTVDASSGVSYSSTPNVSISNRTAFIGLIQVPGGSSFTSTPADAEGLTDAATKSVGKAASDAEGLTDVAAKSVGKVVGDAQGLTDSASASLAIPRSAADSEGLTDGTVKAVGKVVADPEGLTDGVTAMVTRQLVAGDSEGVTDSIFCQLTEVTAVADSEGLGDSLSAVLANVKTAADPEGLADGLGVVIAFARSAADGAGLTDSVTASLESPEDFAFNKGDTIALTDAMIVELAGSVDPAHLAKVPAEVRTSIVPREYRIGVVK